MQPQPDSTWRSPSATTASLSSASTWRPDSPDLAVLLDTLAESAAAAQGAAVEAHAFRDATGLGRKRAIQILEFFNRIGYTRRVRDAHLLRPDAHWQPNSAK